MFGENIIDVDVQDEMKKSFIDYSMSVITSRALPDARDGFKPIHRRIVYMMNYNGYTYEKGYKKCARIVGDVMGHVHPHGDASIYEALVRMEQDFSLRYPLIDGQGNFGSIDGDDAAAQRYTEARLSKLANEMTVDINKETVKFVPNYDGSFQEPEVLPAKLPNLLINGSTGIAVGMATNMPPHNLIEIIDGILATINNPNISIDELINYVKAPDFPTSGVIIGTKGIKQAYRTGRGIFKIRGVAKIEETKNEKHRIIITEIPYQVNKSKLVESIANLVKEKIIEGVTALRDESDRTGIRVIIELNKSANPEVILNNLWKNTSLETSFGIINLALVNGIPKELNLKELIQIYINHRLEIILKRSQYDLNKAEARIHVLEGLKIALDNIDAIVSIIRSRNDLEEIKEKLSNSFNLDEIQVKAILDMKLQKLSGMEREKLKTEHEGLIELSIHLREIITNDDKKYEIIKTELIDIKERFGDSRKTKVIEEYVEIENENLIPDEEAVVVITNQGYIKRIPLDAYKSQNRGGKGVIGIDTKDDDFVKNIHVTSTHDTMLFFTNTGKIFDKKVYEIPEFSRTAKGKAIINLLNLKDEYVTTTIPVKYEEDKYLFMATKYAKLKKCPLSEFKKIQKTGMIAINLEENDELVNVALTDGNKELIIVSRYGKAVRFHETDVNSVGRIAKGVRGMKLMDNDYIISLDIVDSECDLLTVTENGFGKRTSFEEYHGTKRGGKGVATINANLKNGYVSKVISIHPNDDIMFTTLNGIMIRLPVSEIRVQGRVTQGSKLMNVNSNDKIVSVARIINEE